MSETTQALKPSPSDTQLFLEPFGGLAGDMFLASLLDLGDPRFTLADLTALAEELVPGEAVLTSVNAWRGSLSGTHLTVATPETREPPHRHLKDLVELLERSSLSQGARDFTVGVLRRIAVAEGHVHGCSPDEIHFHEVGAVDTLIDVGGAALGLERLGVTRAFSTPPILGSGTVRCAHGEMPVPAPATAEILKGATTILGGGGGERCTPTGAAILMQLLSLGEPDDVSRSMGAPAGQWESSAIGYGAGTRDPKEGPPNILRVQLGSARDSAGAAGSAATVDSIDEVRVNLDDMTPEDIGYLIERLRERGALEAFTSAVQMKKDRPGVLLTALVRSAERQGVIDALFQHSTTFGVRWSPAQRQTAGRRFGSVDVNGHAVAVKVRSLAAGAETMFFEHDDLRKAAAALGVSLEEARRLALQNLPSAVR